MKTSRPATSRASRAMRTAAALILLELVGEELPRELGPVRPEAVRLDQLGARADVAEMHLEHALGRAEVRLLGAAQPCNGAREQGAHAAVGDDRRVGREPLLEAAHASSWMVRPSIPPATVTSSPVTWPDSSSEARTTTARATSSATRDFAQRHRPAEAVDELLLELAARHRGVRPARRDSVHAAARRDPNHLVLEAEQQPDLDRRLRGRVVGVAGLAEAAGGRADEDEAAVALTLDEAEEPARREERRREVRAQRRLPALERELPDRLVLARPEARDRGADVDAAELPLCRLEQPVDLGLHGQVGLQRDAAGLASRAPRRGRGSCGSGSPRARPRPRTRARTPSRSRPPPPVTSTRFPASPVSTA